MTPPRKIKSYLTKEREVIFVDPDPHHLPLIRKLNPAFSVRSVPSRPDFLPTLSKTRTIGTGLPKEKLPEVDDEALWQVHAEGLAGRLKASQDGSATLLDVKVELAKREFLDCRLCGHECGVNRFLKPGKCGLKVKAYVAETYVHIAEEAVITPAATVKLFQCALNCAGCQSWELIHQKEEVMATHGRLLDESIWSICPDFEQAATIEFVGGNPSESLYQILKVLTAMPLNLSGKPLVWNDHGYTAPIAYDLLDGIVDVYLPDFKGCDSCVEKISKVKNYWNYATKGIEAMAHQKARIIVRILVLPGHNSCCHRPALEWLAQYRDRLWVSLLEFIPDYRALQDPQLNRRTSQAEMAEVKGFMKSLGLRDVEEQPEDFWKD